MRPRGSPKSLEEHRRRVVVFLKQKLSLHEIARRMGCHASSVLRWRNALRSDGQDALKAKQAQGRPPRLTSKQKERLVRLLAKGAMAHGYRTELWTTQRIADLIERQLGVCRGNPSGWNSLLSESQMPIVGAGLPFDKYAKMSL